MAAILTCNSAAARGRPVRPRKSPTGAGLEGDQHMHCLPTPADRPPTSPDWIYEIKHDGFRVIARAHG